MLLPAVIPLLLLLTGCADHLHPEDIELHGAAPRRWSQLLDVAVTEDGRVDYDLIATRRRALEAFLVYNAAHGPEQDRMRYAQEDRKIAFLANAYNAAVIYGVLENWPLDSVRDVDNGIYRFTPGAGFFLGQKFRIDGEWVDLYYLEHQYLLGQFEDPFIHVMLNCASVGCPPLRYWEREDLDEQQEAALRAYLASPQGMRRDDQGWAITELFVWFEDQFVDWSDAEDLCGFLAPYAPSGDARAWLEQQQGACDHPRTFPYDWSLNAFALDPR